MVGEAREDIGDCVSIGKCKYQYKVLLLLLVEQDVYRGNVARVQGDCVLWAGMLARSLLYPVLGPVSPALLV